MDNSDVVSSVVQRYAEAAKEHGDSIEAGDSRKTNKAHDAIYECLKELRSLTDGDVKPLESLFAHENRSVRAWAATHTLYYLGDHESVSVLEEIESGHGLIGFDARMVLQLWRDGTLKLPPGFE